MMMWGYAAALLTVVASATAAGQAYYPPPESQGGWRRLDRLDAVRRLGGVDPARLDALREWLLRSDDRDFAAVIIRHGYIVLEVERGDRARTDSRRVASVSKAICATVLAVASERSQHGLTPGRMRFEDPAFRFIPWAQPLSDPRKARITVKQLLNHTSGICPEATGAPNEGSWEYVLGHGGDARTAQLAFDPGTACGYSTLAFDHASLVCQEVTGKPYDQYAVEALFRPLGIERWWFDRREGGPGLEHLVPHGMGMPARDLARIAYCMLHRGQWRGRQVIPRWFVDQSGAPTSTVKTPEMRWKLNPQVFTLGWELPARHWPASGRSGEGIPADARAKPGSGGQLMAFVPGLDMVVVRQTGGGGGDWPYEEYLRRACGAALSPARAPARAERTRGPLRVCASNPRYFADRTGRAVYLTGAHTWSNLQDMGTSDPPKPFDFERYLDFLARHHHNFIRGWRWEQPRWKDESGRDNYCAPQPWQRTGPGVAADGKPKFDLARFDPAYFDRLRRRVVAARNRGVYVSLMLFEGWGMQFAGGGWQYHPFNPANNVNGIGGAPDDRSAGLALYTLADPKVIALQEAYVRKVIDTVHDLDNVLYEISNENHAGSTDWQYHMVRFVKGCEAKKRFQHPVGMTFQYQGGSNATLFASPADWISPNPEGGYRDDPPPADGRKVVLSDTDHLWGEGGDERWVWKSFCRGLNPLYMDRIAEVTASPAGDIPGAEAVRRAMGVARQVADRLDLARMRPRGDLASTGCCLADPGRVYLVYLPDGGAVTVDLAAAGGQLTVEWIRPVDGDGVPGPGVSGGARREFRAPPGGDAVLCIRSTGRGR